MTSYVSPAAQRHAAALAYTEPDGPRDLSQLTPAEFRALPYADRARLHAEDPERYRTLRDAPRTA